MGSFEEFSEAVAVMGQKKEALANVMGLMMSELAGVEKNSEVVLNLSTQIVSELESKQKQQPMDVVESVQASYALLNSKKRWLEEGMQKLDEKVKFARGISKKVKEGQVQFSVIRDSMDQQLKELGLKEKRILHLYETLNLTLRDVEERKNELGSMDRALNGRKNELGLEKKRILHLSETLNLTLRDVEERKNELGSMEKALNGRKDELGLEEKRIQDLSETLNLTLRDAEERKNELDAMEKALDGRIDELGLEEKRIQHLSETLNLTLRDVEERKNELGSMEKALNRRKDELGLEEKRIQDLSETLNLTLRDVEERKNELGSMEKALNGRKDELGLEEKRIQDLSETLNLTLRDAEERKNELDSMIKALDGRIDELGLEEKRIQHLSETVNLTLRDAEERKNELDSRQKELEARELEVRAKEEMLDKRQPKIDFEHIKGHPQKSGSNHKLEKENSPSVVIVEGSESYSDMVDNFASKHSFSSGTEKVKQERKFNVGDVWSCFDSKDALPRAQVQVISINDTDENDLLKVKRLKPWPVYDGEKEWIDAGFPVTCGMFSCSGINSMVSSKTLCHPASCVRESPWVILPCEGETWAIYKDWDIFTWSSKPRLHRNCKYDIVEIVSDPQDSSLPGIKVSYLKKIEGSPNLFQRRSFNHYSFLMPTNLYRFSHRVPSLKKDCMDADGTVHCIFELDSKFLPEGRLP